MRQKRSCSFEKRYEVHRVENSLMGLSGCVSCSRAGDSPAQRYEEVRDFQVDGAGMEGIKEDLQDVEWKDRRGLRVLYAGLTTSFNGQSALSTYLGFLANRLMANRGRQDHWDTSCGGVSEEDGYGPASNAGRLPVCHSVLGLEVVDDSRFAYGEDFAATRQRNLDLVNSLRLDSGERAFLQVNISYPGEEIGHAALLVLERLRDPGVTVGFIDANASRYNRNTDAYFRDVLFAGGGGSHRYLGPLLPVRMNLDSPGEAVVHTGAVGSLTLQRLIGASVTPTSEVRRRFPWWGEAQARDGEIQVWNKLTQAPERDPSTPLGSHHLIACFNPLYKPFVVDNCRYYFERPYGLQTDGSCAAWALYAVFLCLLNPGTSCVALSRYLVWASLGGRRPTSASATFAADCPLLSDDDGVRFPAKVRLKSPLHNYDVTSARLIYSFLQYCRGHCAQLATENLRGIGGNPGQGMRLCALPSAIAMEAVDSGAVDVGRDDWAERLAAWKIEKRPVLFPNEIQNLRDAAARFRTLGDDDGGESGLERLLPTQVHMLLSLATLRCDRCGRGVDPREGYLIIGSRNQRRVRHKGC